MNPNCFVFFLEIFWEYGIGKRCFCGHVNFIYAMPKALLLQLVVSSRSHVSMQLLILVTMPQPSPLPASAAPPNCI
jgi:hypothetical protein